MSSVSSSFRSCGCSKSCISDVGSSEWFSQRYDSKQQPILRDSSNNFDPDALTWWLVRTKEWVCRYFLCNLCLVYRDFIILEANHSLTRVVKKITNHRPERSILKRSKPFAFGFLSMDTNHWFEFCSVSLLVDELLTLNNLVNQQYNNNNILLSVHPVSFSKLWGPLNENPCFHWKLNCKMS